LIVLLSARTSEGRKRAQAAGVKMGRPSKLDPFQQREAWKRRAAGESPRTIGRSYGVHRSTIERLS
jgi:DNA invertase Pin-like site-specific DNA recombinase